MNCHSCHKDVDYRDTKCYHCGANLISDNISSTDEFKEKAFKASSIFYKAIFAILFLGVYSLLAIFLIPDGIYIESALTPNGIDKEAIFKYGQVLSIALGYGFAKWLAKRELNS